MYIYKGTKWERFKHRCKKIGKGFLHVLDYIISDILVDLLFKGFFRLIGWFFKGILKALKHLIEHIFD
ncbi:hypothetical protein P4493_04675 [Bacillus thuringiensis]|uniref:Uncharacterized protein n=3 Tax=Bacillus thuringiensis TaxID=1428 RepID=A0A0B5NKZ2_BACTU|nr:MULTISPECIES: hypothetical protein [Bacillus]EAO56887.1 hypothetical protein RBTH_07617 [Bacillus thuringiensis serovar israelensis ATCC 35646]MEC2535172.1 hypothetical protein [Bacillus cereus]MED1153713.1 hypothetical protein [Bacillus paranthracis]OUB09414.1 hypothetical protein BK708_33375 [Bacillus thuringiensis serovar yunnanensis]AFQ30033.1 hypothetical protein BTF1_29662 [Bacillus thuringiensis HD-789]